MTLASVIARTPALFVFSLALNIAWQARTVSQTARLSLDSKPVTLATLATTVREQIGAKISFPKYLAERRLHVVGSNVTIRELIDGLCELEGWSWSLNASGEYAIEGPFAGRRPGESVYGALKRITPPDLAAYFKMPPMEKYAIAGMPEDYGVERRREIGERLSKALSPLRDKLVDKGIRWSDLETAVSEELMRAVLFTPGFITASGPIMSNDLWQVSDPRTVELKFDQGAILLIGYDLPGRGRTWFGARVVEQPR
jgi:hypothetical protein